MGPKSESCVQHPDRRSISSIGCSLEVRIIIRLCFSGPPIIWRTRQSAAMFLQPNLIFCTLFCFGCRTISIVHLVFDGAIFHPLSKALFRHFSLAVEAECQAPDADANELRFVCWFVRTPDLLHGVHNALKWGMPHEFDEKQRSKDIWAVVASLRNSFGSLHPYITSWVFSRLTFRDASLCAVPYSLWCILGMPPEDCNEAERLKIHFLDGCLIVSDEHASSQSIHNDVYMMLFKFFSCF